ncbi:MAG: DUF4105 domain-containing protein [Desulfuromonadaceae bacterium]|nr:DUF4105 domain-containing protein [Desulfuromonadaceae bacterium]MDD4129319.1 DUF4105 domain-containing protein [Desulfuromonadaceae bacterium]
MTLRFIWFKKNFIRFFLLAMAGWGSLAILYSNLPAPLRPWTASIFGLGSLVAIFGRYSSLRSRMGFLVVFAAVLVWWLFMSPSNSRNWQPDVAVLPWAEFRGATVIIHNIRNCDYRSETDYTVRYYDRTFDMSTLKSVDLVLVHWGIPSIAHTMLSFEFEGGGVVTFSVETRKEIGEDYSNFKGFFRQYELTYVVADERDLVGLRVNYRHEQVYLYRLHESADLARSVFLDYLQTVNSLKEKPQWYNALTDNCTTSFRISKAPYNPDTILDWRLIANGFIDEMLYERGAIDTSMPFSELKKLSLINERAKGIDKSPDFSKLIRTGLPGMGQ